MSKTSVLRDNLAAIVHHVELSKAGWRGRAFESIVQTLMFEVNVPMTDRDLSDNLNIHLDTPVGNAQVLSIIRKLHSTHKIIKTEDGKYLLAEETRSNLESNISDAQKLESQAERIFNEHFKAIESQDKPNWENFKTNYLSPLISELGARTYDVISCNENTAENAEVHATFLARYPVENHRKICDSIAGFLNPKNRPVRRLILSRLNATFMVRSTALNEAAFKALSQATSRRLEMVVFVDTNFLFSLIGLHENPADDVVSALDNIIKSAGGQIDVKLYVLPITLDEAKYTIAQYQSRLSGAILNNQLARSVKNAQVDLGGITLKYINEVASSKKSISASEYFAPYLNSLVEMCRANGVELFNENTDELRTDQAVIDDYKDLEEYQARTRVDGPKPYPVIIHDVVLWHFANRKRKEYIESPVNAKYWVATLDFGLLGFDRHKRRNMKDSICVAIHPTVLIQILQFWVPQSEKLEIVLIDSLQPLLPHKFDKESEKITLKILRVLSRYENIADLSEETISNIIIDEAVRSRIQSSDDLDGNIEIVESSLVARVKEIDEEKQNVELKMETLITQLKLTEKQLEKHDQLGKKQQGKLESKLQKEKDTKKMLIEKIEFMKNTEAENRTKYEEEMESIKIIISEDKEKRRNRNIRLLFLGMMLVGSVTAVWFGKEFGSIIISNRLHIASYTGQIIGSIIALLFLLIIAEIVGSRIISIKSWKIYQYIHKLRKWLWGIFVTFILSIITALISYDMLDK